MAIRVSDLLAYLSGRRVPSADPLCLEGCGRPADTRDGGQRCAPCILRLTDLALHPGKFPTAVVAAAYELHRDVVEIANEPELVHLAITQRGIGLCGHGQRLTWRWTAPDWPGVEEAPA
ncbi:MAG: hypothetical protein L0221_13400 [Chloroflexi bacterium]|nr:hypothetical protein [Chloroflexota bacterium]